MQQLKIFEAGPEQPTPGPVTTTTTQFRDVYISATSNALMVVENWDTYGHDGRCYVHDQRSKVSIVDVSDPGGAIRVHARFETRGRLSDQFKQTYVWDDERKTATYYGIFARQSWDCAAGVRTQNILESWDVTTGAAPRRLGSLSFGKPNETVRGTAFDLGRKVVYAITAEQIDPLYAIGIADPRAMKILSAIDGLSGDISVFRLIGGGRFLLGVGQDNSTACTGFQDGGWQQTRIAVSIVDVQDLSDAKLVQRQCVRLRNVAWTGSSVSSNLDQAHKLIGMHSDDELNVVTVPVYYWKKVGEEWWYHQYETAVGLMTWDLARYDPARRPAQQQVIQNFGTFVHPNGEVRRSIVFRHRPSGRRKMINLSDTHASFADVQDLANPTLDSVVEIAPAYNQIHRFGDYLVEQVQPRPNQPYYYGSPDAVSEFRVRRAGGDLDGVAPVATFAVGQVQQVLQHGSNLILFRRTGQTNLGVLVYDLSDPTRPRAAGRAEVPSDVIPYYRYSCGVSYHGAYWFDPSVWTEHRGGLVFVTRTHQGGTTPWRYHLTFLDLRNPDAPAVQQKALPPSVEWAAYGLVPDLVDPRGFYLTYRTIVGQTPAPGGATVTRYRHYAQRWEPGAQGWGPSYAVNLPGSLVRTMADAADGRRYLTQSQQYTWTEGVYSGYVRLSLLRPVTVAGKPAAELLDSRLFENLSLSALVLDGARAFLTARPIVSYHGGAKDAPPPTWEATSDRLLALDLSQGTLRTIYDQPTRAQGLQLMGTHRGQLFLNLPGDGILAVDAGDPQAPVGVRFLRTLGWATHLQFFDDDAYVAAGHFGLYHWRLSDPPELPAE